MNHKRTEYAGHRAAGWGFLALVTLLASGLLVNGQGGLPVPRSPYSTQPVGAATTGTLAAPESAPAAQFAPPANVHALEEALGNTTRIADKMHLRQTVTLAEVQGHSGDIMLDGMFAKYTIPLPISRRYNIQNAKLRLSIINSVALNPKRSNMSVFLNGYPVYQTILDGANPAQVAEIDLPASRFEKGYATNEVQILLNQHYTEDACEAPYSPDLWTQVDQFGSTFSLDAEPVKVLSESATGRLNLDALYLFLEQAPWYPENVHVVFPGTGGNAPDDDQLSYGAFLAQAIALRQRDKMALNLSYGTDYQNDADNVIIGNKSEIAGILDSKELSLINGPYISIKQNSQNPTKFILVVSGNNPAEIRNALTGLGYALVQGGLPAQDFWQVEAKFYQPDLNGGNGKGSDMRSLQQGEFGNPLVLNTPMLEGGGIHYFASLGMGEKPYASKGLNYGNVPLRFYLPGDFFVRPDAHVKLVLKYTTGRGMGAGSVINVVANGTPAGAVELVSSEEQKETSDQSAAVYDKGRTMNIPASVLRPGLNVLDVQPRMFPKQYELCTHVQTENLTFGLSPLSELVLPKYDRFTQLPDLQLLDHTGFPLTRGANGADLSVFVPERSPQAIVATWLYFADLVQKAGTPLQNATFSFSLKNADRQLLVVSSADFVGQDILTGAPINADQLQGGRLPQQLAMVPIEKKTDWLDGIMGWLGYARTDEIDKLTVRFGRITDIADGDMLTPAESGMIVQYKSNFSPSASVVLVTAQNPDTLLTSVKRLVTDTSRKRMQGDLVLWNATSKELRVDSYRFGTPYNLGTFTPRKYFFFDKPQMFTFVLVGVILAFALVSFFILRRLGKAERS